LKTDFFYMRSPKAIVLTSGAAIIFVDENGGVLEHPTDHPREWSQLMQVLAAPSPGSALLHRVASIPDLNRDLWARLVFGGFLLEASEPTALLTARDAVFSDNTGFHLVAGEPRLEHLVVACTGSVVAGLIAPTILSFCYSGFQRKLDVILTRAAQKFVTRDLFESYGIPTWGDAFERRDGTNVPHVQLGRSADCILVMPASASSLYRLAAGACTDLMSMVVSATEAPVVVAPVMNDAMWNNPAVQRNVQQLREDGMHVVEPTIIFGAADLSSQGKPMYGGHGSLWSGPLPLMHALSHIVHARQGLHPNCAEISSWLPTDWEPTENLKQKQRILESLVGPVGLN